MRIGAGVGRRTLWVGFLAVLAPLLVLLALQYRWLMKLEKSSKTVHKAQLASFLEAATQNVEYTYREKARVLDVPVSVFTQGQREKAAYQFKKKGVEGARRLFVVSFVKDDRGPLYFEPTCDKFYEETEHAEAQAVWVAAAPWRTLAHKKATVDRVRLTSEERDPNYRILLYPITDDSSHVVGVTGMILDEEHFRSKVLPDAIKKALSDSFEGAEQYEPVVSVKNGDGQTAFATVKPGEALSVKENEAERSFSFVFTDWSLGLASRHATPALVGRRNFLINICLSAALAAVLLGGLALSLRTASREMKLSQMKNEFVSNVSHELRTPLASIRVFGEFLRLGRVDNPEKIRSYGDYIETESRRLTQLINNILDFASIESGRKTYHFERSDVREVVCETLKTFEIRLRQSGFSIVLEGADTPLPPARIDAGAIAQSLSNLLDNAVKYSRDNKDVIVSLRREGEFIVIAVQDHGVGIPRDEQAKVFDRFHRVSTGLIHDVKGSGLGLSIVRHIVEAHGGKVTVESRPGEGSTFFMYLPIELAGSPAVSEAAVPAAAPGGQPSKA